MTHLEMKQTLKTHFSLNLNAYNKFYVNRSFKELFWLRSESRNVVSILHEYLNIYWIIISLGDSFWAPTSLQKLLRAKTKSFWAPTSLQKSLRAKTKLLSSFAEIEPLKAFFWFRSDFTKAVLISIVYLNI